MEKAVAVKASNRRSSERRKPRRTVKVECRNGSHGLGPDIAVGVLDLSDTGVRMIIKSAVAVKKDVEITISGYGMMKAMKVLATIRWVVAIENGQFCIGAEFQKRIPYREW